MLNVQMSHAGAVWLAVCCNLMHISRRRKTVFMSHKISWPRFSVGDVESQSAHKPEDQIGPDRHCRPLRAMCLPALYWYIPKPDVAEPVLTELQTHVRLKLGQTTYTELWSQQL